ncbi:MAG: 16S rRNA (guanine(527)-N(7))-methyltransferase RsmG, partial [Phycisphaerales bacterium]
MKDQTHSNHPSPTGDPSGSPAGHSPADAPPANSPPTDRPKVELDLASCPALTPPPGWVDRCGELGIVFEGDDLERLGRFLAMLLHANTRMNLTAIRDEAQAWDKHIYDALTLVPLLAELEDESMVIDIGSGGGLPGVPLAIVMGDLRFTLMDATRKKCDYLQEVVDALDLKNARVINARAEQLGHDRGEKTADGRIRAHRERYDIALARGVGPIAMLAELTVPLLKVGGLVLMTKGQRAEEELAEAKQALYLLHTNHAGTVETETGKVVVLEKMRKTPRDYPRR